MENNNKSALKIKQVITTTTVLIILSSNVLLLVSTKEKEKKEEIIENSIIQQEVAVSNNREVKVTSRASASRIEVTNRERQEEVTYKLISEITISKDMDLTIRCGISKEDFKELMRQLKEDTSKFFYQNSDTIYDLCEKYELNEIFFCGLIAAESGWNIASNHRNKCNYISMMSKGKLIRYHSIEEGLEAAAKLLHNKYLTKGGSYYRGKTLASVQKVFCPNSSTWVGLVYGQMKRIIK